MRRKRNSRVLRPAVAAEMPGNHPAAYDTCAFVQRLPGETTSDLMNGILQATMNVTGIKDGLGVNEAAAEVRLPDGSVFEAIGFGPKRQELRKGCVEFAVVTQRGVAFWSESGLSLVATGQRIDIDGADFVMW